MRRAVCLAPLVLTALVLAGCDTDDPLVIGQQAIELTMTANNATTTQFLTWIIYEDNDNDFVPDDSDGNAVENEDGDVSLWCQADGSGNPTSVPWGYSLSVTVIREGQTLVEQLTSDDAATDAFNTAPYDTPRGEHGVNINPTNTITITHPRGECDGNPDIRCNPNGTASVCGSGTCTAIGHCELDDTVSCDVDAPAACAGLGACIAEIMTRRFVFSSLADPDPPLKARRELTAASREVLQATTYSADVKSNFIADACEGDMLCAAAVEAAIPGPATNPALGVCPGKDEAGDAGIDPGNPLSTNSDNRTAMAFDLQKGDTVIVEARRSNQFPEGEIPFTQLPGLRARMRVDGTLLQSDEVEGNLTSSPSDPSPNISFSFTSK
jgi:hypothetical protein